MAAGNTGETSIGALRYMKVIYAFSATWNRCDGCDYSHIEHRRELFGRHRDRRCSTRDWVSQNNEQ